MTSNTLKTMGTSIGSSLFTLFLVLACTAGADKADDDDFLRDSSAGGDSQSVANDTAEAPDDAPSEDTLESQIAALSTTVEAQQVAIAALEEGQASLLCFIGHMTDEQRWDPSDEAFEDIEPAALNSVTWRQGPNTDSSQAYEDCF